MTLNVLTIYPLCDENTKNSCESVYIIHPSISTNNLTPRRHNAIQNIDREHHLFQFIRLNQDSYTQYSSFHFIIIVHHCCCFFDRTKLKSTTLLNDCGAFSLGAASTAQVHTNGVSGACVLSNQYVCLMCVCAESMNVLNRFFRH